MSYRNEFTSEKEYGGYFVSILKGFSEYLNATLEISDSSRNMQELMNLLQRNEIDFATELSTFVNIETISDVFAISKLGTIVPFPSEVDRKLYIIKPLDWDVWTLYLVSIFYLGSYLYLLLNRKDLTKCFCLVLQGLLSQSLKHRRTSNPRRLESMLLFITVLGFLSITWYNAMLGSFLTSVVRDKPVDTWNSILSSGLKIGTVDLEYSLFVKHHSDDPRLKAMKPLSSIDLSIMRYSFNDSMGYTLAADTWEFLFKPIQQYLGIKRLMLSKADITSFFLAMNMAENSIYKEEFNKYMHRIKDVGLFRHWCKHSLIENLKSKLFLKAESESVINVLKLDYFLYVWVGFGIGYSVGFLVFFLEIYMFNKLK